MLQAPPSGHVPPGQTESLAQALPWFAPPRQETARALGVGGALPRGILGATLVVEPDRHRRCGLAIGPLTAQTPHGRWVAAQLRLTVTSPFEMIGARCEMPVQPVSRIDSGLVASAAKFTVEDRHSCSWYT